MKTNDFAGYIHLMCTILRYYNIVICYRVDFKLEVDLLKKAESDGFNLVYGLSLVLNQFLPWAHRITDMLSE